LTPVSQEFGHPLILDLREGVLPCSDSTLLGPRWGLEGKIGKRFPFGHRAVTWGLYGRTLDIWRDIRWHIWRDIWRDVWRHIRWDIWRHIWWDFWWDIWWDIWSRRCRRHRHFW